MTSYCKILPNVFFASSIALLSYYLKYCKQCVVNGDSYSDYSTLDHGVPQGSLLGVIILLIYIKDLPLNIKYSDTFIYAADSDLVYAHSNLSTLVDHLNYNLACIDSY